MSSDCLFCKILNKEIPADIVHEDDRYMAFRDVNPQAPTHILVIPRKHIRTVNDLTPEDEPLVGGLFTLAARLGKQEGIAEPGYRTLFNCNAMAGQTVWHLHLHLIGGRAMTWPPG